MVDGMLELRMQAGAPTLVIRVDIGSIPMSKYDLT